MTWRNWWLDARLAVPAHFFDMAVFTAIIFSTNGYTSPFFLFFILPLLSAAIRWGWRETALTAAALVLLLHHRRVCSLPAAKRSSFSASSCAAATLLILSAVLIWFGIHQQFTRLFFSVDELDRRIGRDEDPLRQALRAGDECGPGRARAALLVGSAGERQFDGLRVIGSAERPVELDRPLMRERVPVVLFDLDRNRIAEPAQSTAGIGSLPADKLLDNAEAFATLGAVEGLVADVRTRTRATAGSSSGTFPTCPSITSSSASSSAGPRARSSTVTRCISAIEEGAAARTRLSLARDVHDSVVQFLAGAAFRVEAIMRGSRVGRAGRDDLKELKRLLIEEQGEIRGFVSALRRDRELELAEAVEELQALAQRLEPAMVDRLPDRGGQRRGARSRSGSSSTSSSCFAKRSPTRSVTAAPAGSTSRLRVERRPASAAGEGQWLAALPCKRQFAGRALVAQGAGRSRPRFALAAIRSRAARTSSSPFHWRSGRMTRILLADDHPMIGAALEVLLRGTEYELIGRARSGSDALAQVQRLKPDLLLLDVNMPDGSGLEVLRQLREFEARTDRHPADGRHGRFAAARGRPARAGGHRPQDIRPGPAARMHRDSVGKGERWVDPEVEERTHHARRSAPRGRLR